MILFTRAWRGPLSLDFIAASNSLGLFAGHSAPIEQCGQDAFAALEQPRGRPAPGWRVPRSPAGWPVLFHGWIDNRAELRTVLGLAEANDAVLYGAAIENWGDAAEARLYGCYAAVICLPDGTVRLTRSPWGGKGLFYANTADSLIAASITRPLFAAGLPKRLRPEAIDRLLTLQAPADDLALFTGIDQVPHGAVVRLEPGRASCARWYDPLALPTVRLPNDEAYVETAQAHLAQATRAALESAVRPGVTLSGGLDSSLVCAEALRQIPSGTRLPSFTFTPLEGWQGSVAPHQFADDGPWVEAFAAMHPALDPHYLSGAETGFDDRAEQVFAATDAGHPARVLGSRYHDVFAAARDAGCDWLLTADMGNLTLSNAAPWAPGELLLRGRWGELRRWAAGRIGDPRPVWRRIAAHAVMPRLPGQLQRSIRKHIHGHPEGANRWANPFLSVDGRLATARDGGAVPDNLLAVDRDTSRAAYIAANYHTAGLAPELGEVPGQVFGIQVRDVTADRRLIEFCLGLPTNQFVRGCETRRLARRMAVGRLPDAQRLNRLYGMHNADWHSRMTPRVPALQNTVAALRDHPHLGALLDVEAMGAALDAWPDAAPTDPAHNERLRFFLPAMIYVARFVDHATGRNPSA